MGWTLVGIAFLGVMLGFGVPARIVHILRKIRLNNVARRKSHELLRYRDRLKQQLQTPRTDSIEYAIRTALNNDGSKLRQARSESAVDLIADWLRLLDTRLALRPRLNAPEFFQVVSELELMVRHYSRYCVSQAFEHLKSGEKLEVTPDHHKALNEARDQWNRFLQDFGLFLEDLNQGQKPGRFSSYFEKPVEL